MYAILGAFFLLCLTGPRGDAFAASSIKVGTYNIHGGVGIDGVEDIPRLARVLKAAAPDIIGLNEVNRYDTGAAEDVRLAEELGAGWTSIFGKTIHKPLCDYGSAILTRLPVVSSEEWLLSDYPGEERRGMIRVTVRQGGHLVHVFCTHLGLKAEMRLRHAKEISGILQRFNDAPRILVGDFNEGGGSKGVEFIAKDFIDTWARYGLGAEKTFSSIAPVRRIDYIWIDKILVADSCYVAKYPGCETASDHLPVFANILLPEQAAGHATVISTFLNDSVFLPSIKIPADPETSSTPSRAFIRATSSGNPIDLEYRNPQIRVLQPVIEKNFEATTVGTVPSGWSNYERLSGARPAGEVVSVGRRKLWRQSSEQLLSYRSDVSSPTAQDHLEVTARIKTIAMAGGEWKLGLSSTAGDRAMDTLALQLSHQPGSCPRLEILAGQQVLKGVCTADHNIDPYDWNNYTLEVESDTQGKSALRWIRASINGRQVLETTSALAMTAVTPPGISMALSTIGRPDSPCEIYADFLTLQQWVAEQQAPLAARQMVGSPEATLLAEETKTLSVPPERETLAEFPVEDIRGNVSFAVEMKLNHGRTDEGEVSLGIIKHGGERQFFRWHGIADATELRVLHNEQTLGKLDRTNATETSPDWNKYKIVVRTFHADGSPIESNNPVSQSWGGFF